MFGVTGSPSSAAASPPDEPADGAPRGLDDGTGSRAAAGARRPRRRYGGKTAEQRRAERREALVAAALDIWQESGWAAVTMRGVCARAGLTDRYFYESFADRDALLAHVWDLQRGETLTAFYEIFAAHADARPLAQLDAVLAHVVHRIGDEPHRAQILFGDHAGSAVLEQRRRDSIQMMVGLFLDIAGPQLRPGVDPEAFRMNVLVGIGGFVEAMLAWRAGDLAGDADVLIAQLSAVAAALAAGYLRD